MTNGTYFLVVWKDKETGAWHVTAQQDKEDALHEMQMILAMGHKACAITFHESQDERALYDQGVHQA